MKTATTFSLSAALLGLGFAALSLTPALADSTPTPSPSTSTKAEQQAQVQLDRMHSIQQKGDGYITPRLTSLNSFLSYTKGSSVATSSQAQSVIGELGSEVSGLTTLKGTIDAFSDPSQIKTGLLPLVQDIFSNYRVYAVVLPKDHGLLHVAYLNNLTTNFATVQAQITQEITFAQGQNLNVSTLQADNTKYGAAVSQFSTDLNAVQGTLAALTPQGYPGNESSFATAKTQFGTVHTDAGAVQAAYKQFVADFKALFGVK